MRQVHRCTVLYRTAGDTSKDVTFKASAETMTGSVFAAINELQKRINAAPHVGIKQPALTTLYLSIQLVEDQE